MDCSNHRLCRMWLLPRSYRMFDQTQSKKICPILITSVILLKAFDNLGDAEKGSGYHQEIIQKGLQLDPFVGNSLNKMYAKCGLLSDAQQVFNMLQVQTIVSWNALITGYAEHGPNQEALVCYDLMKNAGRLLEAEKFLETMPLSSSKDMWLPLLSVCETYVEVDIGYRCFQKLVHIDPDCGASYMLMSNIYASAGRWEDAERINEMKNQAGSVKYSSVQSTTSS